MRAIGLPLYAAWSFVDIDKIKRALALTANRHRHCGDRAARLLRGVESALLV